MKEIFAIDENICQQILSLKLTPNAVEQELRSRGIQPEHSSEYMKVINRMRNAKRRSTGFICMASGALLGFLSCVLTITNVMPHLFNLFLYGLTAVAVCIVVLGLYYVFE